MPRSTAMAQTPCLTDELLAELVEGRLPEETLAGIHRHAAECQDCHSLIVMVAQGGLSQEISQESPPEPSPTGWIPPTTFDEFRLVRPLGRGAMGVVYLAHDRSLERQVAVKFIAAQQPNARARERFQTEARAIARLQHPNVVTVFRVGEVEGHPYIVSEYLVGQSLAELALPVPWRRALSLGTSLVRGLAAAHRQGVLHRDLKPDNAFLTSAGEVKLLDFGLAELVDPQASAGPSSPRAAGTPRYMAPELFLGASATPRSDLYSLGLLLYELCTGTVPTRQHLAPKGGLAEVGLAQPSKDDRGPALIQSVPGIDPDFASLIERCLRVDPEERVTSAEALCAELERLEPRHEPEMLPEGNPYRGLAPFEAEHRALFFGRDADIRAVIERLRRQPLVFVAGDSGVGKSSLCRAGILPRVAQGALDEYRDFSTLTLDPGRQPLAALAAVLAPVLGQTERELGARLAETPGWLGPALRAVHQERRGLLLFVDQLEELVTLSEPAQATRFASILSELALPSAGVRVLLSVRGDFLTRVGALPGVGTELERALFLLRPLSPDGIREAVVGPARSRGVVFESEALIQTLVEATEQSAGSLPLLQFALAELWERRDPVRGLISRAALEEMGGVAGALSRHADGVLARLDRAEQQAARRLLGRLITAEGTRSQRSEEELLSVAVEARTALRALIHGRLLHARTADGSTSYEIAHEALIANWGTLRQWLDEDAGQLALRQRIEKAGAEWERLGRVEDLLWREHQLGEARALEVTSLGTREQSFLKTSQRAVRRRRLSRWGAALFFFLTVGVIYGGPRLQAHRETQRFVKARLEEAKSAFSQGRELGKRASESRERALSLFNGEASDDAGAPVDPQALWLRANEVWDHTLDELKRAEAAYSGAERSLDDALDRANDDPDVRQLLIELTYDRILLTERFHQEDERTRLIQRFDRLTAGEPEWRGRIQTPAELELETTPPGASIELTRYMEADGVLRREPVPESSSLGTTPIARLSLPAGSYHLRFTQQGRVPVDQPLWLERGEHVKVALMLPATVPEGYVYIPPGCFLTGSAASEELRAMLLSPPLHRRCLQQGYLIGRTEVTLGEWIKYLDTLPHNAPERHLLESKPSEVGGTQLALSQQPDGQWQFTLSLTETVSLPARAGEPIRYPGRTHHAEQDWRRFPLAGVSAEDLKGYLAWLDRSGQLPGARLCNELEWAHAASGADDRRFPHGNRLQKDEANIDATYDFLSDASGPDEVGSHPASVSPFGVLDMAGNIMEIAQHMIPKANAVMLRGGAWYYGNSGALIANRQQSMLTLRDPRVGVRLCASFPTPK